MSIIENLLAIGGESAEIKPSSKNSKNFLLSLLETFKNDKSKLSDILKNLNIKESDINSLMDKTDDKDIKELLLKSKQLLKSQPKTQPEKTSDDSKNKNSSTLLELLSQIQNNQTDQAQNDEKTTLENILDGKIKLPEKMETKFVEITKKIIDSQKTINKEKISQKEINTFKELKSIKELVEYANKKGLNIKKIVTQNIQQTKTQTSSKEDMPKSKFLNFYKLNTKPINNTDNKKTEIKTKPQTKLEDIISNFSSKQKTDKNKAPLSTKENTIQKAQIQNQPEKNNIISELIIKKTDKDKQQNITKTKLSPTEKTGISSLLNQTDKHEIKISEKNPNNSDKNDNLFNSAQTSSIIQNLKQNIIKAKESIKHFSNTLNEAIQNYKPPISKLSLEMHPKELGKVEVTILHRGDNIQIQINSNNNAVSFLHSQQQELRQNLINMGYTDVNMSFNSNQQQGQKQYKQNQKFANQTNEENDELIIEIPYQYA